MPQPEHMFEEDKIEVDSYHQQHFDDQQALAAELNSIENPPEIPENKELEAQASQQLTEEDKFSDIGDVTRGIAETALQPVLGVADFATDAVGIVPWLKPID